MFRNCTQITHVNYIEAFVSYLLLSFYFSFRVEIESYFPCENKVTDKYQPGKPRYHKHTSLLLFAVKCHVKLSRSYWLFLIATIDEFPECRRNWKFIFGSVIAMMFVFWLKFDEQWNNWKPYEIVIFIYSTISGQMVANQFGWLVVHHLSGITSTLHIIRKNIEHMLRWWMAWNTILYNCCGWPIWATLYWQFTTNFTLSWMIENKMLLEWLENCPSGSKIGFLLSSIIEKQFHGMTHCYFVLYELIDCSAL